MKEMFEKLVYIMRLPECQGPLCSKQARYIKINRLQWDQVHATEFAKEHSTVSKIEQIVGLNGCVSVYEISGCGSESCYSHVYLTGGFMVFISTIKHSHNSPNN